MSKKQVGTGQSHALMAVLATKVRWDELDGDIVQKEMIEQPDRIGAEFMRFLQNRGRVIVVGSKIAVDRSKPFDPETFIGKGWKIEEQDERSLALPEIDLSAVRLESMLKPEDGGSVQGKEKLRRLKADGRIRLDAAVFKVLWDNQALIPESWKGKLIFFDGTVLRSPSGRRCVLCLCWAGSRWAWDYYWLDFDWGDNGPSAVLASE